MTTITFDAGLFLRRQIRHELEKADYLGHLDEFKEIKGLLASEFVIKNPNSSVLSWLKNMERQSAKA